MFSRPSKDVAKTKVFGTQILTIETAIHASGIPPLVVFLLEAKEIRVLLSAL